MALRVSLPDGSPLDLDDGATVFDAAVAIGPRLAKAAIAGRVGAASDPDVTQLVDTRGTRCTTGTPSPSSLSAAATRSRWRFCATRLRT